MMRELSLQFVKFLLQRRRKKDERKENEIEIHNRDSKRSRKGFLEEMNWTMTFAGWQEL